MKRIVKDFHSEMAKGLAGKKSSLKMIPAYVDRPTGGEKGLFIALDLGGTNFRILELELKGNGRSRISKVRKFVLDKTHLTGTQELLFDFIADCNKTFLGGKARPAGERLNLGFTFSFPIEQTGISSGTLLRWTKGFLTKGVIGEDVVKLLNEALIRKGLAQIKVVALANDTVATLVAKSYEDPDCDIAVILGTGTNACYSEAVSSITKWLRPPATPTGRMIVNTEWGNFNKPRRTRYDKMLDETSVRPGQQILEKMVSGMYLGSLAQRVLKDILSSSGISRIKDFKTEYMSAIESDSSKGLSKVKTLLRKLGIAKSTKDEREIIKKVCRSVSLRASRISAAAMAALVTKIDPGLSRKHTIAIDGSLYEKHPHFSSDIKSALKELFGKKASRIKMSLTKDGSGRGAAIIAAIASSA